MSKLFVELTEDEFHTSFRWHLNHLDTTAGWAYDEGTGCLFAPHGEESIWVCTHNRSFIWTLVDGDEGDMYILNGYHRANRIGYLISVEPVQDHTTIQVRIPVNHDDQGVVDVSNN